MSNHRLRGAASGCHHAPMPWNPAQYLRYRDERLRPALDLLGAIGAPAPAVVVDLGCGTGNVTRLLQQRWPEAEITGVDGSPEMLERAGQAVPGCSFILADIAGWKPDAPPDVIYANAALQWLAEHEALFPRLLACLAPGGTLAVQMPAMHDAPLRRLQYDVAANGPWAAALAGVGSAPPILPAETYWELLRPRCRALQIWETTYLHALAGENAVAAWASGSSLRPFLDALAPGMREDFLGAYAEALRAAYPPRPDGTTLLAFKRLFIVAEK
jgi:trans-aconitate 2-methyltransferase